MKILLSFDIDGTLEAGDPPGPLTFEMVVKAKELGCTIGSASDRALSAQQSMWDRAGIEPHFTAQKHRFDELLAKFPDHDIISEETVWEDNNSKYRWVIDPLDGTGNFIHKNPNYSVSVALLEENDPLVGVIYIPEIDQLYSAVRGGNAMVNGNVIKTTNRGEIRESMLITGHDPKGELLSSLYPVGKGVRRYGSAAINLAYLACGSADVVWEWDTNPWDVAAGILIVKCAGAVSYTHLTLPTILLV